MAFKNQFRQPNVGWIVCGLMLLTSACRTATVSEPPATTPLATTVPPTLTSLPEQTTPSAIPSLTSQPAPAASPSAAPESSPVPTLNQPPATHTPQELIQAFIDAPFRVVAVVHPPGTPPGTPYDLDFPYDLLVVTERALIECGFGDQRCTDDSMCGSIYTSPVCYFFLEPQFVEGANPLPQFVGQWTGGLDGLVKDSLALSSDGKLQFQSAGGDGPCWVRATWELDTATAVVSELSREEGCEE